MLVRDQLAASSPRISTVFLVALMFGTLAFLYSFLGFFNPQPTTYRIDFRSSISPQEIGGHFLFGYIVALPTRNLKIGILAGLMALALDADHILNAAGVQISIRLSHSISFAILASVLIGITVCQIFEGQSLTTTSSSLAASVGSVGRKAMANPTEIHGSRSSIKTKVFFQLLIITLAAYMSHIAYDVFVDTRANFPLLAPYNFHNVFIPQTCALPIEGAAMLLVYLGYTVITNKRSYRKDGP